MYQFQFERTLEDREALSRFAEKTINRKSILGIRVLYAVYVVIFFALAIMGVYCHKWAIVALCIGSGFFFAVRTIFWHSFAARRMDRKAPKNLGIITVWLEETGVRGKHTKAESFYPYEAFDGVYYYRERYFLTMDGQVVILPERGLVEGDTATLRAFLEAKLQKKVKEIP